MATSISREMVLGRAAFFALLVVEAFFRKQDGRRQKLASARNIRAESTSSWSKARCCDATWGKRP